MGILLASPCRRRSGRLDTAHQLAAGLVGWWPLNGQHQNIVNPNVGGAAQAVTAVAIGGSPDGHASGAFNGSTSKITPATGAYAFATGDSFTISTWVVFDSTAGFRMIISNETTAGTVGYSLAYDGTSWYISANAGYSQASTVPQINRVYHVAGRWTWTGAAYTLDMFVNGALESVRGSVASSAITASTKFQIGLRQVSTPFAFAGKLWDVCVWNRALTDGDIFSLYDARTRWSLHQQPSQRIYAPIFSKARFDDAHQIIGGHL